jgi:hypothetical protein
MKYRLNIPVDLAPSGHHLLQLELEKMLLEEPEELVISLGSKGPMDSHSALVYSRLLATRNTSKTRLVTLAKGGLYDTELLVWLAGDDRDLPPDAWLFLRHLDGNSEQSEPYSQSAGGTLACLPSAGSTVEQHDHREILERLNEYLPVAELTGRVVCGKELREWSLFGAEAKALCDLLCGLPAANHPNDTGSPSRNRPPLNP